MDQTKKIILTALGMALIAFFIGGGTYAYFSDVEMAQNNNFTAGTLDLVVGDVTVPVVVDPLKPGDFNVSYAEWALNNTGNVAGVLNVSVGGVANDEGVETDPETEAEGGTQVGLGERLKVALWIHNVSNYYLEPTGGSLTWVSSFDPIPETGYFNLSDFSGKSTAVGSSQVAGSPNIGTFNIAYILPPATGNEVQGDSCSFNITFTLEQAEKQS